MKGYKYINEKGEHLHTLDGIPLYGTSSVGNVVAKPLAWYGSGRAVMELGVIDPKILTKIKHQKATGEEIGELTKSLALKLSALKEMDVEEYFSFVDGAYRAHATHMQGTQKKGTDLHAELERFIKDQMTGKKGRYDKRIQPFVDWTKENVDYFLWSEGNCYSRKHWVGGICDTGFIDKGGLFGIMDFKSSREAYLGQFWQCAGYGIQVLENGILNAAGEILSAPDKLPSKIDYYSVLPFGMENPHPQFNTDIEGCQEAFLAELTIYKKLPKD